MILSSGHLKFLVAALSATIFSGTALANSQYTKHDDFRTTAKTVILKDSIAPLAAYTADSLKGYLLRHSEMFGLGDISEQIQFAKKKKSLSSTHFYFDQIIDGIKVLNGEIIVSVDNKSGRITKVYNNTYPSTKHPAQSSKALNKDQAIESSWNYLQSNGHILSQPEGDLFYFNIGGRYALVYKTILHTDQPKGLWQQIVDAKNGKILHITRIDLPTFKNANANGKDGKWIFKTNKNKKSFKKALKEFKQKQKAKSSESSLSTHSLANEVADASALVFDPDPRTTLKNADLEDGTSSSAFDSAYFSKTLKDLTLVNGVYTLAGPWVTIEDWDSPTSAPSTSTTGEWTAKRGDPAFNDVNTYYHVDKSQRYMQSLGFKGSTGIQYGSIHVDSNGANGDDNSYYFPSTNKMAFGHGCVDDNEDADVILHEYGHAINKSINDNWGGGDTGAMGEGFGDYWAGSYSYRTANGKDFNPNWVFTWDGHSSCWPGRVMNQTHFTYDHDKTYGAHSEVNGELGDELWSTPLFQALVTLTNMGIPHEQVDQIILEAQFGLGHGLKMKDLALATVEAAKKLYPDGPHAQVFFSKFAQVKILGGAPEIQSAQMSGMGSNGTVDPGEIITLQIPVHNTSPQSIESVSGHLVAKNNDVDVLVADTNYPVIASGDTTANAVPFKVKVPESFECGKDIDFAMNLKYTGVAGEQQADVEFSVSTGHRNEQVVSEEPNAGIPDDKPVGLEVSLAIDQDKLISEDNFSVDMNITHTYVGDLKITLTSPKGTEIILWNNEGGGDQNIIGNFPTSLKPAQTLSRFAGENAKGVWKLHLVDTAGSDVGTLNSFGLRFTSAPVCTSQSELN